MKLKVLIMCPGSWTYGLNSPERGEGRWAQNYARMLAMAGHEVYAASMGKPIPRICDGVYLINELETKNYQPYDLYIDASWWKGKQPYAIAKKYVNLKFSQEEYMRDEELPENFYLANPYPSNIVSFIHGKNSHKTYTLPTMFGVNFAESKWSNTKLFLPGKIDTNRDYLRFMPEVSKIVARYPVEGCSKEQYQQLLDPIVDFNRSDSVWYQLRPYDQILQSLDRCKLNIPILNSSVTQDATFHGVPTIFWEHGGLFNTLAADLGVLIEKNAPPERFTEVVNMMLTDKRRYHEVLYAYQSMFHWHTYKGALQYFHNFVECVF